MDFFLSDGLGKFQDDNGKIHQALIGKRFNEQETLCKRTEWTPGSPHLHLAGRLPRSAPDKRADCERNTSF